MVLPLVIALLFVYLLTVTLALALSPTVLGSRVTVNTYVFVRQLFGLWAGLTWTSVAIYISLISEVDGYYFETWVSFVIGVLLIYVSTSGEFVTDPYWLGVRSTMYLMFSIAGLLFLNQLVRGGGLMSPSKRCVQLYRRLQSLVFRWTRRHWRKQ